MLNPSTSEPSSGNSMFTAMYERFVQEESVGGILLFIALILALIIANSALNPWYNTFINLSGIIKIGEMSIQKPLLLWINDGWMSIFFMLLALEVKREFIDGELADRGRIILPLVAAVGGIAIPALIYLLINWGGDSLTNKGWPIPTTTDVAFVLGVVALLRNRVPKSLKLFLVSLSIVDDILAIAIIALFYTAKLSWVSLSIAFLGIIILILLNVFKVKSLVAYLVTGILVWVCVLKSGVHATLAGVIIGFLIPCGRDEYGISPLRYLERSLHPWVAYVVLPAFVFVNAGITFHNLQLADFFAPVPLGIAMGLFIGKMVGVTLFSWMVVKCGRSGLPEKSNWVQFLAACTLTGVGFTMSLFLSSLAFFGTPYDDMARKGILLGSFLSVTVAVALFQIGYKMQQQAQS